LRWVQHVHRVPYSHGQSFISVYCVTTYPIDPSSLTERDLYKQRFMSLYDTVSVKKLSTLEKLTNLSSGLFLVQYPVQ